MVNVTLIVVVYIGEKLGLGWWRNSAHLCQKIKTLATFSLASLAETNNGGKKKIFSSPFAEWFGSFDRTLVFLSCQNRTHLSL